MNVLLKLSFLSLALLLLTLASAQEFFFEDYDVEPEDVERTRRDVEDLITETYEEDPEERGRYRRDEELVRRRRQGGHGHGNGNGNGGGGGHEGVTGPVHTFVKTDEHAHFKWGVRHHVGHEYAGRR